MDKDVIKKDTHYLVPVQKPYKRVFFLVVVVVCFLVHSHCLLPAAHIGYPLYATLPTGDWLCLGSAPLSGCQGQSLYLSEFCFSSL